MRSKDKIITVFEHEALYTHRGDKKLSDAQLKAFQKFYKEKDFPYYSLLNNGIRFCEYVGVLKIDGLTIEVLPKADRTDDTSHWRGLLIDMMRSIGILHPDAPTYASLKVKQTTILNMYLELFIIEMERLLQHGLVKKYRKEKSNKVSLKGKLLISKQITKNVIHQERFYVQHSIYNQEHLLHQILYMALQIIVKMGAASHLASRYHSLLLDFPSQKKIKINERLFNKIHFDRKTKNYKTAIDIAKIILLNYHPDLDTGSNQVLALMFDMNMLWERFVLKSLQRNLSNGMVVSGQASKLFWSSEIGSNKKIRPDIIISKHEQILAVLDTKWKNIGESNPSDDDLRQLYAYSRYHSNAPSYLLYPGNMNTLTKGKYNKAHGDDSETPGGIIKIKLKNGRNEGMQLLNSYILENM